MTKDEKVQYWLDIAKYDIDTAETLQLGGRWLYETKQMLQWIEGHLPATRP